MEILILEIYILMVVVTYAFGSVVRAIFDVQVPRTDAVLASILTPFALFDELVHFIVLIPKLIYRLAKKVITKIKEQP